MLNPTTCNLFLPEPGTLSAVKLDRIDGPGDVLEGYMAVNDKGLYSYARNLVGILINPCNTHWTLLIVDSAGKGYYLDPLNNGTDYNLDKASPTFRYVPAIHQVVR